MFNNIKYIYIIIALIYSPTAMSKDDQYNIDKIIIQRDQGVVGDDNSNSWNNHGSSQQPSTGNNRSAHPFYEDAGIRIDVLSLENFGVYLNLRLKYLNKLPQIIKIRSNYNRYNGSDTDTYLIDNIDNQYVSINPGIVGRGAEPDMRNGIDLVPGVPKIFSFQYGINNKNLGNSFLFSSAYGYCLGLPYCYPNNILNVSINGITLNSAQ